MQVTTSNLVGNIADRRHWLIAHPRSSIQITYIYIYVYTHIYKLHDFRIHLSGPCRHLFLAINVYSIHAIERYHVAVVQLRQ